MIRNDANRLPKSIREYINNAVDNKTKIELCEHMLKMLDELKVPEKGKYPHQLERINDSLFENKDHWDFAKHLLTGEWKYEEFFEPGEISYDELINDYLHEFWNLCDMKIDEDTRFCWVEL